MYGVVREFQSPQGVTHAARGRFGTSPSSQAVIFARKSSLDVYVVRANRTTARLEQISSTPLAAPIYSLAVVRRPSADLLVLGFRSMRIAILSWHHHARTWRTDQLLDLASLLGSKLCSPSSIVPNFSPDERGRALLRGSVGADANPLIRADPNGRCIAVLAQQQSAIYVVPILGEDDARHVNRGDVFLIDLPTDYDAANIKDFTFLHDSFEPNILFLHEPKPTWAGRAAVKKDTCFLLNISVDLRLKRTSKTWTMGDLPYDCAKLIAIPGSASAGALCISASVIFQVRHGSCVAGLSLNSFGDVYAKEVTGKYDNINPSDSLAECDASHCQFLDVEESLDSSESVQSIALLSLKGGELYFISVAVGSRSTITMKRAGSTVIASEIVPVNDRFFVLASRLSDSLLIEYQRAAQDDSNVENADIPNDKEEGADRESKPGATKRKKRKRTQEEEADYEMIYGAPPPQESSDEDSDDDADKKGSALELEEKVEGTRGVYDDEDELGWVFNSGTESETAASKGVDSRKWALKVKDTLPCFGPGADVAIGPAPEDPTSTKLDMIVAGGYGKNGCLAVVHQTVRPTYRTEFEVSGCTGAWTLLDPAVVKRERAAREKRNQAVSTRNAERRARNAHIHTERQRFVDEAVAQLKQERKEREAEERNEAKGNHETTDAAPSIRTDEAPPQPINANPEVVRDIEKKGVLRDYGINEADGNANENHDPDKIAANPEEEGNGTAIDSDTAAVSLAPPDSEDNVPDTTSIIEKRDGSQEANKKTAEEDVQDNAERPNKRAKGQLSSEDEKEDSTKFSVEDDIPLENEIMLEIERQAEANFPHEADEQLEDDVKDEDFLHSYMLLSTASSTTILKTGIEIEEVMDRSVDFLTAERTITAGNIFDGDSIVQVVASRVRVLRHGKLQCEYDITDKGTLIRRAQVSDPLVLLETEDSRLFVLSIKAERFEQTEADGAGEDLVEVEDFDEYGMALPRGQRNDPAIGDANIGSSKSKDHVSRKEMAYRNFDVSLEFSEEDNHEVATSVATACFYRGSLASEIAADGVLAVPSDAAGTPVTGKRPSDKEGRGDENLNEGEGQETEMETSQAEQDPDRLADEDRMLYGEIEEDEEDMMLYGVGDSRGAEGSAEADGGADNVGQAAEKQANISVGGTDAKAGGVDRTAAASHEKGVQFLPDVTDQETSGEQLLVVVKQDGCLFILSRSLQYSVVLQSPVFFAAPRMLTDCKPSKKESAGVQCPPASSTLTITNVVMAELCGSALLQGMTAPVLVAWSRVGLPLIYKAYMSPKLNSATSRSRLMFKRILFKDRTTRLFSTSIKNAQTSEQKNGADSTKTEESLCQTHFHNIGGRGGLFAGGSSPFFVFAERGYPRVHPLSYTVTNNVPISREQYEEGEKVVAFSEFHNAKCPRGFVSVSDQGVVRIGELPPPSVINFDAPSPMRKIALRCTPHKVAYHAGSATYGVLASMPTLTTREERLARILQSLEKHDKRHYQHTAAQAEAETGAERASRVPPLFEELHELRVYRPDTWELIKNHKLQKGEVGLAIANMTVDVYKTRVAGPGVDIPSSKKGEDGNESAFAASQKLRPKNMLVVGTGHLNGEDASSRGRLLLFEISRQEIFTEAQGVYTAFQMQLIAEKELFSPVTAVAAMEGYVIAGVGPQISVYKLVGDEIIHLSFAFGQLYCSSLTTMKQYLVAGDMCKSVSFMYFRERNNSVNFLGKDYEHVTSYATEFLIENENMGIIVSDEKGNFQMMNYAHASIPESRGGKRLLINGGLNFGSRVNKFVRVRAPDEKRAFESGRAGVISGKHSLLFATLDGGIGGVIAVTETEFKKLEKIRAIMVEHRGVARHAGVNPDEHVAFRPESSSSVLLNQRLLDSRAVFDVFRVSLVEMRMIAREFGSDVSTMVESLLEVDTTLSRF